MSGRRPVCEDAAAIAGRIAELQAERIRMIAGCHCPRDALGAATHNTLCPLRPEPASQMALVLEAMQRARRRIYGTDAQLTPEQARELRARWNAQTAAGLSAERCIERADEIIAEGIAAKYARHRMVVK